MVIRIKHKNGLTVLDNHLYFHKIRSILLNEKILYFH